MLEEWTWKIKKQIKKINEQKKSIEESLLLLKVSFVCWKVVFFLESEFQNSKLFSDVWQCNEK